MTETISGCIIGITGTLGIVLNHVWNKELHKEMKEAQEKEEEKKKKEEDRLKFEQMQKKWIKLKEDVALRRQIRELLKDK